MPPIKSLSPTKVEAAMKCPEQMRLRYQEKAPEPNIGHLVTGTIVHAVLEWALKRRLMGAPLPGPKEADDYFLATWKKRIAEEERKETFIGWDWGDETPERAHVECRALVPFALKEVLPSIKPRLIEENVKMEFGSPVGPFLMWGKLDLMEESCLITDWKTARNSVSKNQKKMGLALPYYTFKALEYGASEIVDCRKIFLVRGDHPDMDLVKYTVGPALRNWFTRVSAEVWKMVQADAFVPNTGGWWCSPKYCSFWDICQGELEE